MVYLLPRQLLESLMRHTIGLHCRQLQVIMPHEIVHILRPCKDYVVLFVHAIG